MLNFQDKVNFIWSVADLLRGDYKQHEYGQVILPLTVMRRMDAVLQPTKEKVLKKIKELTVDNKDPIIFKITGYKFYNNSLYTFEKLLNDPDKIDINLKAYINGFSKDAREIIEKLNFHDHIERLAKANILYLIIKRFADPVIDLHPDTVSNIEMGYIFEELIRRFAEQSNETAGEHFTPREVIRLMVNILFAEDADALTRPGVIRTLYDPGCGTGGMLSVAEDYLRNINKGARLEVFGQEINPESYAICKSDMLIKGQNAGNIKFGNSFTQDGCGGMQFDYMLCNPPFGVDWKKYEKQVRDEHEKKGFGGRFGAGLPRINDGSLLFLQHMISKMKPSDGGSRIAIVFNASPLFTGDAGSGESNIRKWIIENDMLEAIIGLPTEMFYNTGIATYVWVVNNRKTKVRRGKIQLINAVSFYEKMRKSLGNKRNYISEKKIEEITNIYHDFEEGEFCKIFDNEDFGYHKITVERPLRLNFQVSDERIERLKESRAFQNLATSRKKGKAGEKEIGVGEKLQKGIISALSGMEGKQYTNRDDFIKALNDAFSGKGIKINASLLKAIWSALSERDENADICHDAKGNPEPDTELRDYENVPLKEEINTYFDREVKPYVPDLPATRPKQGQYCIYVLKCSDDSFYVGQTNNLPQRMNEHENGEVQWTRSRDPFEIIHWELFPNREDAVKREHELKTGYGRKWLKREYSAGRLKGTSRQAGAWIDETKTRIGYEIPFTRQFYVYQELRPLEVIDREIWELEREIQEMLKEVTG